jgi:hypothetical protein
MRDALPVDGDRHCQLRVLVEQVHGYGATDERVCDFGVDEECAGGVFAKVGLDGGGASEGEVGMFGFWRVGEFAAWGYDGLVWLVVLAAP